MGGGVGRRSGSQGGVDNGGGDSGGGGGSAVGDRVGVVGVAIISNLTNSKNRPLSGQRTSTQNSTWDCSSLHANIAALFSTCGGVFLGV